MLIHFLEPHEELYLKLLDDMGINLSCSHNERKEKVYWLLNLDYPFENKRICN